MARQGNNGLSHHEELRYFYLLRNLSYLSENEEREYRYLKSKMEAGKGSVQEEYQAENHHVFQDFSASQNHYLEDYPEEEHWQDETLPNGLPLYPTQEPLSRRAKKKAKVKKEEPLPEYLVGADHFYQEQEEYAKPQNHKKPKKKGRWKRNLKLIGILLCLILLGAIFMFVKGYLDISANKDKYKPAVTETFNGVDSKDGTNILVLGSDQRVTQTTSEARTDTIMVVNVGNKDNKIKIVSFMRDTLVNIPGYSYNDSDSYDLKLNSSFSFGEQDDHQGAEMVRKTLKHNFDIDCKYYMMVDFQSFAEAIDTLYPNGVEIDAKFATISGEAVDSVQVPDDLRMKDGVVPEQTIKVGKQRMDGRTLLNYARFRKDDDGDYGRTVRQQQVMAAVLSQLKNPTKLFTGSAALGKLYALTSSNIPFPILVQKGISTLPKGSNVDHITIPTQGDWVDEFDMYGGQALYIDFAKYQKKLSKLGLR